MIYLFIALGIFMLAVGLAYFNESNEKHTS